MIDESDKRLIVDGLSKWTEAETLGEDVVMLVKKYLQTDTSEMVDLFDLIPNVENPDLPGSTLVCCCFGYSNLKCRWIRKRVCDQFGEGQSDTSVCGLEP